METVVSKDGTPIAYRRSGAGPPLVLVHGMAGGHERWQALVPRLEPHFTVIAMDRRGRGASGDASPYAIEREFEDVAALAEALGPVTVYGHSYGAVCALEGATRTRKIDRLVLYEPVLAPEGAALTPPEKIARLDQLLAAGDREQALRVFMREVVGVPAEEMAKVVASPAWPARVAAAHTVPRELRAEDSYHLDAARIAKLDIPVLLLVGGDSEGPPKDTVARVAAALPNARTVVLPGQQHLADVTAPDLVAEAIVAFLRG